jgi:hypothetical protein
MVIKALLVVALCAAPAGAQMFPAVIEDKPITDNMNYLYEQIVKVANGTLSGSYVPIGVSFGGDVTGGVSSTVVGNDSHSHSDATITDLDAAKLTGILPAISGAALTDVAVLAATQAFTGENTFSGPTSTTTFSGWVDIGYAVSAKTCVSTTLCILACPFGKHVVHGGCDSGSVALTANYASSVVQVCATTSSTSIDVYLYCARIK